jgi:AraC-like DNA-binding protein
VSTLVDPTLVYFERPDDEQRIAHPSDGGDSCTALYLSSELIATTWGGEPALPSDPVPTTPQVDLRHRLLLAAASRPSKDEFALTEQFVSLVSEVLSSADGRRVAAGRPSTDGARRKVVDDARGLLGERPGITLVELARTVAVSPHHLSRIFRSLTGETISRYRNRLRVRLALERLSEGEPSLSRLAVDLGFSDHAHLTRVLRGEVGAPPSRLRDRLVTP